MLNLKFVRKLQILLIPGDQCQLDDDTVLTIPDELWAARFNESVPDIRVIKFAVRHGPLPVKTIVFGVTIIKPMAFRSHARVVMASHPGRWRHSIKNLILLQNRIDTFIETQESPPAQYLPKEGEKCMMLYTKEPNTRWEECKMMAYSGEEFWARNKYGHSFVQDTASYQFKRLEA